jgi:hypothetical protein
MTRRSKLRLGTMGLAVVIAALGTAVEASGRPSPHATQGASLNFSQIAFAQVKEGSIGGLVVAGKLPRRPRARLYISLHGMPVKGDSDRYLVTADKRPCSQLAGDFDNDGQVDGADFVVFKVGIIMANTEGDFHVRTRLRARLGSAQSVRIYDYPGPLVQKACGSITGARGPRS